MTNEQDDERIADELRKAFENPPPEWENELGKQVFGDKWKGSTGA